MPAPRPPPGLRKRSIRPMRPGPSEAAVDVPAPRDPMASISSMKITAPSYFFTNFLALRNRAITRRLPTPMNMLAKPVADV